MSDLIREPYELSIWQTDIEEGSYINLIPPLSRAYEDEWETLMISKSDTSESSEGWEGLYYKNSDEQLGTRAYECKTRSFHSKLTNEKYTFFAEIKDFKYANIYSDNEKPECTLNIEDNGKISTIYSEKMGSGTLRLELNISGGLAGKKLILYFSLPGGKMKGHRRTPSEASFQIRLSLFEGEVSQIPFPFPYYCNLTFSHIKKERKLFTIGSDLLTAPNRATTPIVKTNVNGEKTLTFSLYSKYFDSDLGDFTTNPFVKALHNESYIKLRRGFGDDAKWEEYIVKNIAENSSTKTFTYTAKRAAAIDLGKTGYNLEFSPELMNNQGTAVELAKQVFSGTDWIIDEINCDKFWGSAVEPVYEAIVTDNSFTDVVCIRQAKKDSYDLYYNEVQTSPAPKQLTSGNKIYIPYSSYQNRKENGYIQFLLPEGEALEIDDSGRIYGASSYIYNNFKDSYLRDISISQGYKGDHLQKRVKSRYVKNLNKIVQEGTVNGEVVYKFTDVEYQTSSSVPELIVNGKDFESTQGWREGGGDSHIFLNTEKDSLTNILTEGYSVKLALSNSSNDKVSYFYNAAIRSNVSILGNFVKGEQYYIKLKLDNNSDYSKLNEITIASYDYNNNNEVNIIDRIFNFIEKPANLQEENSVKLYEGICDFSVSNKEIIEGFEGKNIGLFLGLKSGQTIKIESISLFKKIMKEDQSDFYEPGDSIEAKVNIKENYYDPSLEVNQEAQDLSELVFCNGSDFIPNYYDDYIKISSIEISKSNRFNILQEICEAFECWADLQIEHNSDGTISNKKIVLKNFIGQNKQVGFSYGLNLKDINRTLVSDQIVTKLIVEPNNNENGLNGFSTIARAENNQSKDTAIYNFAYYINQGVLNREKVSEDFYGEQGILYKLGKINTKMTEINGKLIANQLKATQLQSEKTTLKETISATQEEIIQLKQDFYDRTGIVLTDSITVTNYENNSVIREILVNFFLQSKKLAQLQIDLIVPTFSLALTKQKIFQLEKEIEEYKKDQQGYLDIFNNKYANYIQEGTWTDESYYDDDLYYLDAQNVLYSSAFPKVSYTINVIDVSPLGGEYTPFKFNVGDKTYIEDTEFFGWNQANNFPYREEVIISEMEEFLDSPEQNRITIQNYKTQFEDLFQRIAATTQSLQYSAGAFQRAANKITSTNSIDPETVQNSFLQGIIDIQNMGNMSVKWTSEGLLISNQRDPNNKLRLSNVGITQSSDGGETWKTVLLGGRGITANAIVTGTLDANKISIKSGNHAAFIWDARGLRAYNSNKDSYGAIVGVDYSNYIEFNDKGLIAYKADGTKPFELTSNGSLALTGKITAKEGNIGDWYITDGIIADTEKLEDASYWLAPYGWEGIFNDGSENGIKQDFVFFANGNFGVDVDGNLYANNAKIIGHVEATSGSIGGWAIDEDVIYNTVSDTNALVWLAPDGIPLDGSDQIAKYVFYANGKFRVDTSGKLYATEANISGHLEANSGSIGDWHIIDRIIYNSDKSIWLAADNGLNGTVNDSTTNFVFKAKDQFGVDINGKLYAANADISGHLESTSGTIGGWEIKDGYLKSSGITLNASSSEIKSQQYIDSTGSNGWCITNNEAIFNNITLRGALRCAVFEYAEVQAVGGIMMIRPATTIKNFEIIENRNEKGELLSKTLILIVENSEHFKEGDWCKLASDVHTSETEDGVELQTGINYHLFQLQGINDNELQFTLPAEESLPSDIIGMGIIDLGSIGNAELEIPGDIGLGLNSSTNHAMIPQTSFSVFSLEEDDGWKYLKPHIILGKIPNEDIYENLAGSYGLYADNVYLKGTIIANGGKIGNMEITAVENSTYRVVVTSNKGTSFIENNSTQTTTLTCEVYKGGIWINETDTDDKAQGISYQWYRGENKIDNATNKTYDVSLTEIGTYKYSCTVEIGQKEENK